MSVDLSFMCKHHAHPPTYLVVIHRLLAWPGRYLRQAGSQHAYSCASSVYAFWPLIPCCACAGRWHGQDVATKIIHCLPEELPRVLREAEIMLQLDHPNVGSEQQAPAGVWTVWLSSPCAPCGAESHIANGYCSDVILVLLAYVLGGALW